MLDASTVTVGGLLTGDMYDLGHYDQCLAVKEPIRAQHCIATLQYGPSREAFPAYYRPPNSTGLLRHPVNGLVWDKVKVGFLLNTSGQLSKTAGPVQIPMGN